MSAKETKESTVKVDKFINDKKRAEASVVFYSAEQEICIRHKSGCLPEILDAVDLALRSSPELNIFVHAKRLVRVHEVQTAPAGIQRHEGAIIIHPLESSHLTELIGRAAIHVKYDMRVTDIETGKKGTWVSCDCPRRVAEAYISRGHWPDLPTLTGFVEAPTLDQTGRLIDKPGYDSASGLYLAFSTEFLSEYKQPKLKANKKDAIKALEDLSQLFDSFPFVSEEDRSAIIASIITSLVRRILPSAPMFAVTAPMPGTGKSILAETSAIISTGRRSSVLSLGHDDAELEKRLGGVLLAGDAAVMLDNIERPLGGDLLCQVTTQPSARIRPLGGSSVISVPTHSLLLATGNNLSIIGDLKRRVVLVRLDAKIERPEQRAFSRNHIQEVLNKRGEIVSAALTLSLAYLSAGAPSAQQHVPFGSFELWDKLVRRPLLWLGYPDPLGGAEALRDNDPDLEAMRALYGAWSGIDRLKGKNTAAEVVNVGLEYMIGGGEALYPELRDSLQLVCSEKPNARRLGNWLRSHRDRIVDGMQLERCGKDGHAKVAKWRIVKCN
jgi:putative DNA primase/helicase